MNDPQLPQQPPQGLPPHPPTLVSDIAPRDKRFWAAMIDGFIGMMVSFPVFDHFGVWEALTKHTDVPDSVSYGLTAFSVAVFFVLHGYLLYQYGQTIGKRLMGLAIVTLEGDKPSFLPLILNRYLPQWVMGFIPGLGPFLATGDILYIFFNPKKRCIHDLIARTVVIDLSVKTPPKSNRFIA